VAEAGEDWRAGGFGVYVHWPFCAAKCPYCDFNSHVPRGAVDHARWRAALIRELAAVRAMSGPRRADTVFFGGGTPSLMHPDTVAAVVEAIDRLWGLAPGAEITLEANPTSVEAEKFSAFAGAGVNRVSMGIQALNDADLRALGRMHSADEARAAFGIARDRFARVSFDLIYARTGQDTVSWLAELAEAMAMAVDHLSLYQLTIEPGTRFADLHARGRLRIPDDDSAAALFSATREACAAAGMPAYEVSNHAHPGAESQHNLIYWRYGDYAGVGPGAHGRLTRDGERLATQTPRDPARWLCAVEAAEASLETEPLTAADQGTEYLLMAMRLAEGADLDRFARLNGTPVPAATVADLAAQGLVRREGQRLRATERGVTVLNAILRALLA
jgi:oxygen-independent coproporphyrinogen-3 oxidase